jgi:Pectate lyase superfamily protein
MANSKQRLPELNKDKGAWGRILNDYLKQISQNPNGGLNFGATIPTLSPRNDDPWSVNDEGYTFINSQTNEILRYNGATWDTILQSKPPLDKSPYITVGYKQIATDGSVNIADFVVDGIDDHIEIQQAIDYASTLATGGTVLIKSGVYQIGASLVLKAKVSLIGESRNTSVLKAKDGLNSTILITDKFLTETYTGKVWSDINKFTIAHLGFDGNSAKQGVQNGVTEETNRWAAIKIFGYGFHLNDLFIYDMPENGIYTEHGYDWDGAGTFNTYQLGEAKFTNLEIKSYRNIGLIHRGPHDSFFSNIKVSSFVRFTGDRMPLTHILIEVDREKKFGGHGAIGYDLHPWGDSSKTSLWVKKWVNPNLATDIWWPTIFLDGCFIEGSDGPALILEGESCRIRTVVAYALNGILVGGNANDIEVLALSNIKQSAIKLTAVASGNSLNLTGGGAPNIFDLTDPGARGANYFRCSTWLNNTGKLFKNDKMPALSDWGECYHQGYPIENSKRWIVLPQTSSSVAIVPTGVTVIELGRNSFDLYLTDNTILQLNNPRSGETYQFQLMQDGAGYRTVGFPANVKWQNGIAPTPSGPYKSDFITLRYNGNVGIEKFYGSFSQNYDT